MYEETNGLDFRWQLIRILLSTLPIYTGGRVRAQILRWAGFHIGRGVMFWGTPILIGGIHLNRKLTIGNYSRIGINCLLDLVAPIAIGDHVVLSPEVLLLTGKHQIDGAERRIGQLKPLPIDIDDGVWLGARCIVLPGVTVGKGAIVGAGAVVTRNVPSNTLVAGVPARVIRQMDDETIGPGAAGVLSV